MSKKNIFNKRLLPLALAIATVVCIMLSSCGDAGSPFAAATTTAATTVDPDEQMIIARIEAFEFAYSSGDIDAIVECFDARTRNGLDSMLSIGSSLFGIDLDSWLVNLFGFSVATQGAAISIMIDSISMIDTKNATVDANMSYTQTSYDGTNYQESAPVRFDMVKENGDWYIKMDMSLGGLY